jgi:uncharacterized membrane protein
MEELRHRLRRLPDEEIRNALSYYEEYFDEAGPQNELATVESLGSPAAVASKIIGEYAVVSSQPPPEEPKAKKKSNALLITLLAMFPITLPLAVTLFALVIAFFAVFFSLLVAGAAVSVGGVVTVFLGIWSFSLGFANGLFYTGFGLFMLALGLAIAVGFWKLFRLASRSILGWMGRILIRRGAA